MGRKTTKTDNAPWLPAQPHILEGMEQTRRVFNQQQPQLDKFSGIAFDTYGKLNPGAVQGIQGAQGLVNDTIGGKFLSGGNPYLNDMVDRARKNVLNDVKGSFTAAGRFGSNAFADTAADAMASAELGLRYDNYGRERQAQIGAVGQAQDLMRGNAATLDQAATLPWTGVGAQVGNIRQASSGYGTTTTTTRDPWGTVVGLAGAAATAAPAFSDPRIKENVKPIGQRPDGLGVYEYDNKLTGQRETGVMADEVAKARPDALGPTVGGLATVDYAKLGQDAKGLTPKVQRPGIMGALDRVVNPDTSTTLGKIGLMGQALMAGSGGPLAPLGQAMLGTQQEIDRRDELQHQRMIDMRQLDVQAQNADALADWRAAQIATRENPAQRLFQRRDGSIVQVDPVSGAGRVVEGLPGIAASEPVVATADGYLPRSQAVGKMPYRAPSGGGGGGGLTANARATMKAQAAEAIAKGADPAKVRARLREMGVE